MRVNLSAQDVIAAAHLAGVVRGVKEVQHRGGSVRNRRVADMDDFGMHLVGMLGEIAVAKTLGCDIRSDVTVGGDGEIDLSVKGQTVQVKTSTHGKLHSRRMAFLNSFEEFSSDWLIVCSVASPSSVEVHGFISRRKFFQKAFNHDFGYGNRVAVWEDDLSPIEKFEEATAWTKESA